MKKLFTFGDSWTYGVGLGYNDNQTEKEYFDSAHDKTFTAKSYRQLLADSLGYENVNFAEPGSSNQTQFRKAREYFLNNKQEQPIVLWGLTSVYRIEVYDIDNKEYRSVHLPSTTGSNKTFSKIYATKYFDEEKATEELYQNVRMFNIMFTHYGIKNYWYNIFNEHSFSGNIHNILFDGQSLLSILSDDREPNDNYHKSNWNDVDRKIKKAEEMKLVNPFSKHPTELAHKKIHDKILKDMK